MNQKGRMAMTPPRGVVHWMCCACRRSNRQGGRARQRCGTKLRQERGRSSRRLFGTMAPNLASKLSQIQAGLCPDATESASLWPRISQEALHEI